MTDAATTPLWLSHHYPGQYDRCVVVAGRHLCRRCAVMYPFAVLVGVVALLGVELASPWSQLALVLLPIPALVEFVGEHRGRWAYAPRRHTVVSALQGLGVGVGFVRYFHDYADPWFWGIGVLYSLIAGVAALTAARDESTRLIAHHPPEAATPVPSPVASPAGPQGRAEPDPARRLDRTERPGR